MSFFREYLMIEVEVEFCLINRMELGQFAENFLPEYLSHAAVCLISEGDAEKLSIKTGDGIQAVTREGMVNLKAIISDETRDGIAIVPIGLWGHQLYGIETFNGIPSKRIKGKIRGTDDPVLTEEELINNSFGA